jgi:hypothetical protein
MGGDEKAFFICKQGKELRLGGDRRVITHFTSP